ncbi:MAG: lysylphosphatidylglycerol synthase domain-containing protein [Stellaceae bacterium]
MAALLAQALKLPIAWLQCFLVVPVALLMTALPVSIAGWGVREAAFVVGFGFVGLPASDALALSLLLGLVQTLVRLPGGLVWLATNSRSSRRDPRGVY